MDESNSEVRSQGEATPEVAPEASQAGAGRVDESAGSATWRRRIAPRHRRAVRRFFGDRTDER